MPSWIPPSLHLVVLLAGLVTLWLLTMCLAYAQGRVSGLRSANRPANREFHTANAASEEAAAQPALGSAELAAKVYDSAMTGFYVVMLDEAMKALSEAGYSVIAGGKGEHTLMLPDAVREEVARRVHYKRQLFVAPLEDDEERRSRVERDVRDGYAQLMLDELILGWAKAGVFVVAPAGVAEVEPAGSSTPQEKRFPAEIDWFNQPVEFGVLETESPRK
jgi:hypothetical protein